MTGISPRIHLTKLDVIRRQLRMAIRLFFEERDIVSIHTLAGAVQELLRDLLLPRGEGSFIKDSDWIVPERHKEFIAFMNKPQNFFKHADKDPDDVLEFPIEATAGVLLDCAYMYRKLTGRDLREGRAFCYWYAFAYPEQLKPGPFADAIASAITDGVVLGKAPYLDLLAKQDLYLWKDAD